MPTTIKCLNFGDVNDVDQAIIYREYGKVASPYTYVTRIVDLNLRRLQSAYKLRGAFVDYEAGSVQVRGEDIRLVDDALERIRNMIRQPVFSLQVDPDVVVVLRILKEVKQDFSAQTGCWLHFIWARHTVSCYGLDGAAARAYIHAIVEAIRQCALSPEGLAGCVVAEREYPRGSKYAVKRAVDFVETTSGAKVAIKKDDVYHGSITVQCYGTPMDIQKAFDMIQKDVIDPARTQQQQQHQPQQQIIGGSGAQKPTRSCLKSRSSSLDSEASGETSPFHPNTIPQPQPATPPTPSSDEEEASSATDLGMGSLIRMANLFGAVSAVGAERTGQGEVRKITTTGYPLAMQAWEAAATPTPDIWKTTDTDFQVPPPPQTGGRVGGGKNSLFSSISHPVKPQLPPGRGGWAAPRNPTNPQLPQTHQQAQFPQAQGRPTLPRGGRFQQQQQQQPQQQGWAHQTHVEGRTQNLAGLYEFVRSGGVDVNWVIGLLSQMQRTGLDITDVYQHFVQVTQTPPQGQQGQQGPQCIAVGQQ